MKKLEILNRIPIIKLPNVMSSDAQIIMRLVTILAATHLANKVEKVIKEIEKMDNPDTIIRFLK